MNHDPEGVTSIGNAQRERLNVYRGHRSGKLKAIMILHLDMDAFFAAVEKLDNPALAGKCVVVGSDSPRAVVAAASYEARRFGVRSAMPVYQARRLCPQVVVVPPRHRRYKEISEKVMSCLRSFSPLVEQVSIDEAFVDITGCGRLYGEPARMARRIKAAISDRTGLTCSVGIAPCKFLAKIASDLRKPDGLTVIEPARVEAFIARLPVSRVPGVGARARRRLEQMGIETLGQVRHWPPEALEKRLGSFGLRLAMFSRGRDDRPVRPCRPVKSISREKTLAEDTRDKTVLQQYLLEQAQAVARSLRSKGLRAARVYIKLKSGDFRQYSRQCRLDRPCQSANRLYRAALGLLEQFGDLPLTRLIGLGAAGLGPESLPRQDSLFDRGDHLDCRWEKLEQAADTVSRRFGRDLVKPATLAGPPEDL